MYYMDGKTENAHRRSIASALRSINNIHFLMEIIYTDPVCRGSQRQEIESFHIGLLLLL